MSQQISELIKQANSLLGEIDNTIGSGSKAACLVYDAIQELHRQGGRFNEPPSIDTICLSRVEGKGAGQSIMVRTIDEANAILGVWSASAPGDDGGYDKTDVTITFADGTSTKLRADLQCNRPANYLTDDLPEFAIYITGDVCRLGHQVWSGDSLYLEWAWAVALQQVKNVVGQYARLVRVLPGLGVVGSYIHMTTIGHDPLETLRGDNLMAKVCERS